MEENTVLVELRFDSESGKSLDIARSVLNGLDVVVNEKSRDPSIVAALTVAAAVTNLTIELIKLAREFRNKPHKPHVVVVKLSKDNLEETIDLPEATDEEIEQFLSN